MDAAPTTSDNLLDAVHDVVKAASPAKRETLVQTIDAYLDEFPDDYFWSGSMHAARDCLLLQ